MANGTDFHRDTGDSYEVPSYMHLFEFSGIMKAHIIFMIVAWACILPIGVVFSIAGHRHALVVRSIFLVISGLGLIFGILVNSKSADLYKGNMHHIIGWVAVGMVAVQASTDVLLRFTRWLRVDHLDVAQSTSPSLFPLIRTVSQIMYNHRHGVNGQVSEGSRSNTGRDIRNVDQHYHNGQSEGFQPDDYNSDDKSEDEFEGLVAGGQHFSRNFSLHKYFTWRIPSLGLPGLRRMFELLSRVIDWTILVVGYITLVTGGVTYAGIFRGSHIYNGLAHFIKGGIFFWYGLLTLGRWAGCFSNVGWAWNVKPPCNRAALTAKIPSAEFVESFVIFLYGSSNMFLEHLAGWGKAWTASDLEHVSISIMFFGGGLCGMLVESKAVRTLLNTRTEASIIRVDGSAAQSPDPHMLPKTYSSSTNTFPALVILLLGVTMSSHHQSSMLSTTVHKQWGMLLSAFAVMRILTYIVMYISPATSFFPSRPPSELIASFCLISGGIVFMASTRDIIQLMEDNGLMAMFVFTIAVALTAFIMAWEIMVLSVKGLAELSEARKRSRLGSSG